MAHSEPPQIKLPHPSLYPKIFELKNYKFRKLATIAEIEIQDQRIAFYGLHAAAFNTTQRRRDIAQTISLDAKTNGYNYCIIGGDFNSMGGAEIDATVQPFLNNGFSWSTKGLGQTTGNRRWFLSFIAEKSFVSDHISHLDLKLQKREKLKFLM